MASQTGRKPTFPHDLALQLVLDGHTIRAGAARFGVSEGSIQYVVRKAEAEHGERLPRAEPGRPRSVDRARVFALLDSGVRQAEVARRMGVSECFVSRVARHAVAA